MNNQHDSYDFLLSPAGELRREKILLLAIRTAAAQRRRKLMRRASIAGVAAIGVVALVAVHRRPSADFVVGPRPGREPVAIPVEKHFAPERPPIVIVRIETDPTLASRLAIPGQEPTWQTINDDVLLQRLAQAGRPAGLAYIDGRTKILYRDGSRE